MGTVHSLEDARRARADRHADAAAPTPSRLDQAATAGSLHPALRWVVGDAYWLAHRMVGADTLACGLTSSHLTMAPPGVPLCVSCYPPASPAADSG